MGQVRRVLDIEHALHWAYRDELPKQRDDESRSRHGPRAPLSSLARYVAHGTIIDTSYRDPGFPAAMGSPHDDAHRIHAAVQALRPEDISVDGYARRFGSDPVGIDVDDIALVAVQGVGALIQSRARLGSRPDFLEAPAIEGFKGPNGHRAVFCKVKRKIETNGRIYDVERDEPVADAKRRAGFWPAGSFSRISYVPGRVSLIAEWAEYAAWHAGLCVLAQHLAPLLTSICPTPPSAPARPWMGDVDAKSSGRIHAVAGAPGRDKAKVYGRRAPLRPAEPVRHLPPSAYEPSAA